jgi:tRNA A37 methylthiotransferase MiaB
MDTPIACTLSADQYKRRTADLAALGARALRSRERTAGGERLTVERSEEIERELDAAIAAEASCCSFLHMDVQRHDDRLVLDIAGPDEARPVIAELFA